MVSRHSSGVLRRLRVARRKLREAEIGVLIANANALYPEWCKVLTPNRWECQRLVFDTVMGHFETPDGFVCDLFSVVPNTPWRRFWKASVFHDYLCERPQFPRFLADFLFLMEMLAQAFGVYKDLLEVGASQRIALAELRKLTRLSCVYFMGVSGVGGKVYALFGKARKWFKSQVGK